MCSKFLPNIALRECFDVPNDDKETPGTSKTHVEALLVPQETYVSLFIGADAADNDDILFSTLKGVDRISLNGIFFTLTALQLNLLLYIWCNNTYFIRRYSIEVSSYLWQKF